MIRKISRILSVLPLLAVSSLLAGDVAVELHGYQFPERKTVRLDFMERPNAPRAGLSGEVVYRQGQARIELSHHSLKPAILYGGDVTCYVVWAVTRDGDFENLGELLTRKGASKSNFSTGKKNFALMVTAEPYYLVGEPSEMILFMNAPSLNSVTPTTRFDFDRFGPAPDHGMNSIANIRWESRVPIELLQARKAFELATRHDAPIHAAQIHAEARNELKAANHIALSTTRGRELLDASRRAVALSNEAINISLHRIEAIELERQAAARREETEALEQRAGEAEAAATEAQLRAARVREEAEHARAEKERLAAEAAALTTTTERLRLDKTSLEAESERLQREKSQLEQDKNQLQMASQQLMLEKVEVEQESNRLLQEKNELSNRLQAALSHVADTNGSARGYVLNLPDILFGVNEATLKPEAREVMAKLAGILLIMRDQSVVIEGHTDSTGSPEYNLDLSRRRAMAVRDFLQVQGLDAERLQAMGYGMERAIAENSTAEGRKRNRRVEVVISEIVATVATEVVPQADPHARQ